MQWNERPLMQQQQQEDEQPYSVESPVISRASSEPILPFLESPRPTPPCLKSANGGGDGGSRSMMGRHHNNHNNRSESSLVTTSPTSILMMTPTSTPEWYAKSRRKRVSFVTEAFIKPPPIQQRLQGMNLADLDHGVSVCRAAVAASTTTPTNTTATSKTTSPTTTATTATAAGDMSHNKTHGTTTTTTTTTPATSRKQKKPTHVLERRLLRIQREYAEASFELEVGENDMYTLIHENEELRLRIEEEEIVTMGLSNLEDSADELKRKIRKYTSKIATLTQAVEFYKTESATMIEQLQQSKAMVRRSSKDRVLLEPIPEANQTSSTAT